MSSWGKLNSGLGGEPKRAIAAATPSDFGRCGSEGMPSQEHYPQTQNFNKEFM